MKILILHRIPFHKIQYDRGIDHSLNEVTYIGTKSTLENIPAHLPCNKIIRLGLKSASEEILDMIQMGELITNNENNFDRVISLSEYELLDAAKIRKFLNITGPTIEETLLVRDKVLMKDAVMKSGVLVPKFIPATYLNSIKQKDPWYGRVVLKPKDGASSENVIIFDSIETCYNTVFSNTTGIKNFTLNEFQVEEFVDGDILHIDGLVVKGKIQKWIPSKYIGTCLDYAKGAPLVSFQIPMSEEIKIFTEKVVEAVHIREGSFHLEAIQSAKGLVFLEIANRVGGAEVVDTFERATGVFLPAAELASITGNRVQVNSDNKMQKSSNYFGWFVVPGHHLPIGNSFVSGHEPYIGDSHIINLNILKDSPLPRTITYQSLEVPLAGIVCGSSSTELETWMRELLSRVKVESIPFSACEQD